MRRLRMMMKAETKEARSVDAILKAFRHYSNGSINTNQSGFFYTTTVDVTAGQTISWYGKSGAVCAAIFAYAADDGSYILGKKGAGSSVTTSYSWTATEDCKVGICGSLNNAPASFDIDGETITINY